LMKWQVGEMTGWWNYNLMKLCAQNDKLIEMKVNEMTSSCNSKLI
jgi:hypothetical protein